MEFASNHKTVSVVVTTYKRDDLLEETLASLAAQTLPLLDVVVVDDGGPGSARSVVERFGPIFRYLWQPNGGMQSARNLGIDHVTGGWIAFLDDDDLWQMDRHELLMQLISTDKVDLIFGDFNKFDTSGSEKEGVFEEISRQSPGFFEGISRSRDEIFSIIGSFPTIRLFPVNPFWPSTLVLRRDLLQRVGSWDVSLRNFKAEDYDYVFRAIKLGRLGILWKPTVLYRCHYGNFSVGAQLVNLSRVFVWEGLIRKRLVTTEELSVIASAIQNQLVEAHWTAFSLRQFKTVLEVSNKIGWNNLLVGQKIKTGIAYIFSLMKFRSAD